MTDSQIKMIYAYMVKSVYIYAHVNFCLVGVCECGPGDILILWFESVAIKTPVHFDACHSSWWAVTCPEAQ